MSYRIDGILINFNGKPYIVSLTIVLSKLTLAEFRYDINAQVVGGPDRLIYNNNDDNDNDDSDGGEQEPIVGGRERVNQTECVVY